MTSEIKHVCPIKGVSKDCEECTQIGWGYCVYVQTWQSRGKPTISSDYVPLDKEDSNV